MEKPEKGLIFVQTEAFGFSETVNIIGIKNNQWHDYISNDQEKDMRVYANVMFAQRFFFPTDWDVFVTFEPTSNHDLFTF